MDFTTAVIRLVASVINLVAAAIRVLPEGRGTAKKNDR